MIFSQENEELDFALEIDKHVWKPFKEAFDTRDALKFNALHTDNVLRITKEEILQGKEYKNSNTRYFARKGDPKRTIAFEFEYRIHSDSIAYEVGYYKIISLEKTGEKTYFGRFNVLLKKRNGRWKIAQDWDVDIINDVPITGKDYLKLKNRNSKLKR